LEKTVVFNGIQSIEIETMLIDIPKGIDNNELIVLKDRGNVVNGLKGDLNLVFQIQNNTSFIRNGLDLHIQKKISLKEALCGFIIEIPHLNGKMLSMNNMTNCTVIKPNYKKIVPNLGMMKEGQTGNLVIEFLVDFPESISPEVIERLKELL
jgi:DnaJ family protein A protein 2